MNIDFNTFIDRFCIDCMACMPVCPPKVGEFGSELHCFQDFTCNSLCLDELAHTRAVNPLFSVDAQGGGEGLVGLFGAALRRAQTVEHRNQGLACGCRLNGIIQNDFSCTDGFLIQALVRARVWLQTGAVE